MKYSFEDINKMLVRGEITQDQAKSYNTKIRKNKVGQKFNIQVDPTVKLVNKMQLIVDQFQKAASNQQNTSKAVEKFIPLLVDAVVAIKNIKIEPAEQGSKHNWEIHFVRDNNHLQKSPILLKRVS